MASTKTDRNSQESIQVDCNFLTEIQQRLESHMNNPDVTEMDYALKMITDWMSELEDLIAQS